MLEKLNAWYLRRCVFIIQCWISALVARLNINGSIVIVLNYAAQSEMFSIHGMHFSARGLALNYFSFVEFEAIFTNSRILFEPRNYYSSSLW